MVDHLLYIEFLSVFVFSLTKPAQEHLTLVTVQPAKSAQNEQNSE